MQLLIMKSTKFSNSLWFFKTNTVECRAMCKHFKRFEVFELKRLSSVENNLKNVIISVET